MAAQHDFRGGTSYPMLYRGPRRSIPVNVANFSTQKVWVEPFVGMGTPSRTQNGLIMVGVFVSDLSRAILATWHNTLQLVDIFGSYRAMLVIEALSEINENSIRDAFFAVTPCDGEHPAVTERRAAIAACIGDERLQNIMRQLPPQWKAAIRCLEDFDVEVRPSSLQNELDNKRIPFDKFLAERGIEDPVKVEDRLQRAAALTAPVHHLVIGILDELRWDGLPPSEALTPDEIQRFLEKALRLESCPSEADFIAARIMMHLLVRARKTHTEMVTAIASYLSRVNGADFGVIHRPRSEYEKHLRAYLEERRVAEAANEANAVPGLVIMLG